MRDDVEQRKESYRSQERWREFQWRYVNERRNLPRPFDLRNAMRHQHDITVRARPQEGRFPTRNRKKLHHELDSQPRKAGLDIQNRFRTMMRGTNPTVYEQVSEDDDVLNDDPDETTSIRIDDDDRAPKRQLRNNCMK